MKQLFNLIMLALCLNQSFTSAELAKGLNIRILFLDSILNNYDSLVLGHTKLYYIMERYIAEKRLKELNQHSLCT